MISGKRIVCIGIALAALFAGLASPAQAITITGGEQWQRDCVYAAITSGPDWQLIDKRLGGVTITLADTSYTQALYGYIDITTRYVTPEPLTRAAIHEWMHQIWFALGAAWQAKWYAICPDTGTIVWALQTREHFAECLRVTLYPPGDYPYIQTALASPLPAEALALYQSWRKSLEGPRSYSCTVVSKARVGRVWVVVSR